eukprot:733860-Hanusia_phi.AAC.2
MTEIGGRGRRRRTRSVDDFVLLRHNSSSTNVHGHQSRSLTPAKHDSQESSARAERELSSERRENRTSLPPEAQLQGRAPHLTRNWSNPEDEKSTSRTSWQPSAENGVKERCQPNQSDVSHVQDQVDVDIPNRRIKKHHRDVISRQDHEKIHRQQQQQSHQQQHHHHHHPPPPHHHHHPQQQQEQQQNHLQQQQRQQQQHQSDNNVEDRNGVNLEHLDRPDDALKRQMGVSKSAKTNEEIITSARHLLLPPPPPPSPPAVFSEKQAWERVIDQRGRAYFWNVKTGETTWNVKRQAWEIVEEPNETVDRPSGARCLCLQALMTRWSIWIDSRAEKPNG